MEGIPKQGIIYPCAVCKSKFMSDYVRMSTLENLTRAYRWILSNPDVRYKSYFRDAYDAYSASTSQNLVRLQKRLRKHVYEPMLSAKLFFPKPSGVLRPYTFLTVEDQIVYQACINIIAEKLKPVVGRRYFDKTYGHLYSHKSSSFFYYKWQDSYKVFSRKTISNINSGHIHVANFDLAAFYDSIDHSVLTFSLRKIGVHEDLVEFLIKCLHNWTACYWSRGGDHIHHGHGIPQGPLSSGLLSEVVLRHIDDRGERKGVEYLRYVDDIKIFSKNEASLRKRLLSLDLAAKDIGLFPQSGKINMRVVSDPLTEIKSISIPPEPSVFPMVNQALLRKRLGKIIKRGIVAGNDKTRFKYLMAQVDPCSELNNKLLRLLTNAPEFSETVSRYFAKYNRLPHKVGQELVVFLFSGHEIYHSVHSDLLNAVLHNMMAPERSNCADLCHARLFSHKKGLPDPHITYKAALLAWAMQSKRVGYSEILKIIDSERNWWVLKEIVKHIDHSFLGLPSYAKLMNRIIRKKGFCDASRCAAVKMIDLGIGLEKPYSEVVDSAKLVYLAAGKIRRIGKHPSLLSIALEEFLRMPPSDYDWKRILGEKMETADLAAFMIRRQLDSDIDGCLVVFDSLCDLIFEAIYVRQLPGKRYDKIGNAVKHPDMIRYAPKTCDAFGKLHQLRLQSITSHPRDLKTGKPTRRLKHRDYYKVRPFLKGAFLEIMSVVT